MIIPAVLLALFAAITFMKSRSGPENPAPAAQQAQAVDRDAIQKFWIVYRQATAHRIAGRTEAAAAAYRQALELNDRHEDALYYLGNAYFELGNFEGAETALRRLLQINPNSARAHLQLGNLYLCPGREDYFNLDAAEAEFRRAFEINKEETGPLLRLGQVALIRGDLPQAQNDFEAVIGSNFKSVPAYFLNGYIAWKQGNSQKAAALLAKAVQYSRPTAPGKGVLGKGNSKPSASSSTTKRLPCQVFQGYLEDLAALDEAAIAQHVDDRYREVDAFIERARQMTGF